MDVTSIIKISRMSSIQNFERKKMMNRHNIRHQNVKRDFICPCGMLYASYAAVYTHIKNKHQRDKEFIATIQRPNWNSNKKGRPKRVKTGFISIEVEEMYLLEMGLLNFLKIIDQVYPGRKQNENKIIISGNETLDLTDTIREYSMMAEGQLKIQESLLTPQDPKLNQVRKFFMNFTKHLSSEISARLLLTLNKLVSVSDYSKVGIQNILSVGFMETSEENLKDIWFGSLLPVTIILETYQKVMSLYSEKISENETEKFINDVFSSNNDKNVELFTEQ